MSGYGFPFARRPLMAMGIAAAIVNTNIVKSVSCQVSPATATYSRVGDGGTWVWYIHFANGPQGGMVNVKFMASRSTPRNASRPKTRSVGAALTAGA